MTTIIWTIQCDFCDRQFDATEETFHPLGDGRDCCNTCEEDGAL